MTGTEDVFASPASPDSICSMQFACSLSTQLQQYLLGFTTSHFGKKTLLDLVLQYFKPSKKGPTCRCNCWQLHVVVKLVVIKERGHVEARTLRSRNASLSWKVVEVVLIWMKSRTVKKNPAFCLLTHHLQHAGVVNCRVYWTKLNS